MSQFVNGAPADLLGAVQWRKASFSGNSNACVQFASLPDGQIGVRNSRDPHGPALVFTRDEIGAMLHGAAAEEFADLVV
jgi:hypothetical protein